MVQPKHSLIFEVWRLPVMSIALVLPSDRAILRAGSKKFISLEPQTYLMKME